MKAVFLLAAQAFLYTQFILADVPGPSIALVQYNADAHFGDYEHNLARLTEFANNAVLEGSKIIVFPEGSHWGYSDSSRLWCRSGSKSCVGKACFDVSKVAEVIPGGKTSLYWEEFAKKHQVYVLFNIPEKHAEVGFSNTFYNTTAVVGPTGVVAKYRKRSLYYVDGCYANPGNTETVFTTEYGKFGLLTCADVNSISYVKAYHSKKVDGVILVTDWDQAPGCLPVRKPGRLFFAEQAAKAKMTIYASDVSPWDGTGKYLATGGPRERNGLPEMAVNQDGVSYHELK